MGSLRLSSRSLAALFPKRLHPDNFQHPRLGQFTLSVSASRPESLTPSISSPSGMPINGLLQLINQHILASGPMAIPIWMNLCLNHPKLGYYSRTDRRLKRADPFGQSGDFITSPEISQVFGELIAIWFVSRWQAAKSPSNIRIIELGPGRGTLMADIVRTFCSLKACKDVTISINLVENSLFMRELQKKKLHQDEMKNYKIEWFDRIEQVGKADDQWTMVIAHEFFDALPVHIFQKTEMGFREVMVDISHDPDKTALVSTSKQQPLRFALSPGPTLASQTLVSKEPHHQRLPVGAKLEISPSGNQIANTISHILKSQAGGCGLIVDYGDEHHFSNSLRGFHRHQIVDPLFQPGLTDITTNVDFASLKKSMSPNIATYGPINQRDFLLSMGIEVRTNQLKSRSSSASSIEQSSNRLISPLGMGKEYKFLGFQYPSSNEDLAEVYPFPPTLTVTSNL